MKKFIKNPLKVMAAVPFMVAIGYGVSISSDVSELSSFINLSALRSATTAQGEDDTPYYDCPGGEKECVRVAVGNEIHIFYKDKE